MSSGFSFLLFLVVIAQAINSSHSIKPDSDKWGIRSCVIQDEIKEDNYGCMPQEIDITDFEDLKGSKCTPEVDSVKLEQGPNSGVVTLTFFMETPNCRRYYNRSSGVVLQLEVKRPDSIDFVNYKIFSLITEKKFQSNRGVLSYTITVALPYDDAMFYASVYPIRPKKDGHSFVPPMLVGKPEKDNMFIDKIKIPEDAYVECKCDDIIVTINNTISLNLCDSSHFNSSTVTLQGAINICTPTIKNACEEKYSDLVDGVYSVLTYFKCKNNETKDCRKDITIITQKDMPGTTTRVAVGKTGGKKASELGEKSGGDRADKIFQIISTLLTKSDMDKILDNKIERLRDDIRKKNRVVRGQLEGRIFVLEKKNDLLKEQVKKLAQRVRDSESVNSRLASRVNDLEQQSRKKSVRIVGLTDTIEKKTIEECIDKVVTIMRESLKADVRSKDVDIAQRLWRFDRSKPRTIFCKMIHRRKKIEILNNRRRLNGKYVLYLRI